MALPSTCDPEGYTAEKQKGNVRSIPALGSVDVRREDRIPGRGRDPRHGIEDPLPVDVP